MYIEPIERELGTSLPISIPTAIPLEELAVAGVSYPEYEVWINVRTLIRNLLNTLDTDAKMMLDKVTLGEAVIDEMNTLAPWLRAIDTPYNVNFYFTTKRSLTSCFPQALFKIPKTPKQRLEHDLTEDALEYIVQKQQSDPNYMGRIELFDVALEGRGKSVLLVSHQPIDLLSRYNFDNLLLLESHTGKVKGPAYWSSKLQGKGAENLPFNPMTLQIFGDGDTFVGFPRKMKNEIITLAQSRGWTPITTKSKIESDFQYLNDELGSQVLRNMIRCKVR